MFSKLKKELKKCRKVLKELESIQPATWHPLCPYPVYKMVTKNKTRRKKK